MKKYEELQQSLNMQISKHPHELISLFGRNVNTRVLKAFTETYDRMDIKIEDGIPDETY